MKLAYSIAIATLVLTTGVAAAVLLSPMPLGERLLIAQILSISLLLTGGVGVLLLSIKRFKRQLKLAYLCISLSLLLVLVGVWQYVFLAVGNLLDSPWVTFGGSDVPFILSVTFTYLGAQVIAQLLKSQSYLTKVLPTIIGSLLVSIAVALLLLALNQVSGLQALYLAISIFEAVIALAAAILMHRAQVAASTFYKQALQGLKWYCAITAVAGLNALVVLGIPESHWYVMYNIGGFLYVFCGLAVIYAALGFNKVSFAERQTSPLTERARSIDVVLALTSLASQPAAIEAILEQMREATATIPADTALSEPQQKIMSKIYTQIEDFLVTNESLRKYSREGLREMIEVRFKENVDEPFFWQALGGPVVKEQK